MSNRFYFGDDSYTPQGDSDDEDTTTLPFPKPLSRPSFLTPDFEPHAFLSSLSTSNRFQTLEDLQSELRELSTKINKELVDLVNENYEEFVGLGGELRGGEEKVEEVRVGLLGFEKDVKALKEKVVSRRGEVEVLVGQKKELRREIGVGRGLLEVDEKISELEYRVGLKQREKLLKPETDGDIKWSADWDEESAEESDEEYDEEEDAISGRVKALTEKFLVVKLLVKRYNPEHPFLIAQKERIHRVHDRMRVEVETAIRGSEEATTKQKLIQMRAQLDE